MGYCRTREVSSFLSISNRYKAIIRAHFRRAVGALVVYDITNESSFNNVEGWVKELKENADDDIVIMLVGTKLDLVYK